MLFICVILFLLGFIFAFPAGNEPPVIIKTTPFANSFVNGDLFSVRHSAEDMESLTLSYGLPNILDDEYSVTKTDCEVGKNKKCDFENIDLSEFDGKKIDFWFKIKDTDYTIYSRKTTVKVDTTAPILEDFNYIVNKKRVNFFFEIKEKNFKEIVYKDVNNCEPKVREGVLCRNLNKGKCTATKEFCVGTHYLTIKITDKAGNSIEERETIVIK